MPRHKHPAGNHAFVIAAPGTPGAAIEYLLRTYGVQMVGGWSPTGGRWVEQDGTIHFVVRASQARWTTHILSRAGYAILEGATSDGVARADGTLPVPWGRGVGAGDMIGRLVDILDPLLAGSANRNLASAMVRRKAASRKPAKNGGWWQTLRRLW